MDEMKFGYFTFEFVFSLKYSQFILIRFFHTFIKMLFLLFFEFWNMTWTCFWQILLGFSNHSS